MAKKPKAPQKIEMDWELRQLLPPAIHDQWDTLSIEVQHLIHDAAKFAAEYTREQVADSYYDSMAGYCDRPHSDE